MVHDAIPVTSADDFPESFPLMMNLFLNGHYVEFQRAVAWDMLRIYSNFIDAQERRRIERLELFDEFEEWHMMQEHYCVAYAINDAMGLFEDFGFPSNQDAMGTHSGASL